MSRKWQRNKAWEDEHLVGGLAPVRWVLRTFSTIPLAIVLLTFISLFATLASVPIGLIALIPTYAVHALTLLLGALIPCVIVVFAVRVAAPKPARATRFALSLLLGIGGAIVGIGVWARFVWPAMHYDPTDGSGLMFLADFVETYKSITVRRLPGMEMTETRFYAWWPMKLALWLFVINMCVTTVRRIEFTFKNIGVLSVHTGIVMIAVGSVFYQRFKQEGDTLLMAGPSTDMVGPPQRAFFDREEVVLYIAQHRSVIGSFRYQQRRIDTPRYNNYNLRAGLPEGDLFTERRNPAPRATEPEVAAPERAATTDNGRTLDRPIADAVVRQGQSQFVDPDIKFKVVGYSPYADLLPDWIDAPPRPGQAASPMRTAELFAFVPGADLPADGPAFEFAFFLGEPAQRIRSNEVVAIEFTSGMPEQRWSDLSATVPVAASHALIVEIPGSDFRAILPATNGQRFDLGGTGWSMVVKDIAEQPPFPIITEGYQGATSSLAIVELTPPPAADGPSDPIERWVYHRFPEINQDLGITPDPATGRPARGAPDPRIRVAYLDMTLLQVYLDERAGNTVRAIVRQPGGQVRVFESTDGPWLRDLVPNSEGATVDLKLADRWAHAQRVERPVPTPTLERDINLMGSHAKALLGVEISLPETSPGGPWSRVVWLPFSKYIGINSGELRPVPLPGGREIHLAFGRLQRPLPGFTVSLVDFEMVSYDHRGAPRDYQSVVRVAPTVNPDDPAGDFTPYDHLIKLNTPLRAPFHWDPDGNIFANVARRLSAGLNVNQYKFSQAGWDRAGWNETQQLVDQGQLPEPRVKFTILGVGNNPGIHVVAFGSILMALGIPWAFYLKPWMLKREKQRLADAVKAGTLKPKGAQPSPQPAENNA